MRFQKSQPAGAATLVPPSASTGPLKNMDASSPARKAHAHEMQAVGGEAGPHGAITARPAHSKR